MVNVSLTPTYGGSSNSCLYTVGIPDFYPMSSGMTRYLVLQDKWSCYSDSYNTAAYCCAHTNGTVSYPLISRCGANCTYADFLPVCNFKTEKQADQFRDCHSNPGYDKNKADLIVSPDSLIVSSVKCVRAEKSSAGAARLGVATIVAGLAIAIVSL